MQDGYPALAYFPATQVAQEDNPVVTAYSSATQLVHEGAAVALYFLASHDGQVVDPAVLYLPASHDVQMDAEKVPALQVVHVTNELAALLYFPASQLAHTTAPTALLHFPAVQSA